MRDYTNFDLHYSELLNDVYPQPDSEGHIAKADEILRRWIPKLVGLNTVLDIGCGEGFCQPIFESLGVTQYTGIALGVDVANAQERGRHVVNMDMNFLEFPDGSFQLVYSRHSLEHSPFPLLSLMEWHRVATSWLCLVLPSPKHYSWTCPNHYGIMTKSLAVFLMDRAGWHVIWTDETDETEFRFMAEKKNRHYKHEEKFETYDDIEKFATYDEAKDQPEGKQA